MSQKNISNAENVLDVCALDCSVKHPLIVKTWMELPVGGHFILVNGHDPAGIKSQFAAQWPGTVSWEYLAQGPDVYRIKVTKLKPLGSPVVPVATRCREH
jgi:uncharacterized protein (DUF2249 family)